MNAWVFFINGNKLEEYKNGDLIHPDQDGIDFCFNGIADAEKTQLEEVANKIKEAIGR